MIKVNDVSKSFGGFKALDSLDLNVKKGSIYGLVGTNGSGKTTIIKHLTGVYRQDSGDITYGGESVYDNEKVKAGIGFIPDEFYFFNGYNLKDMALFTKRTHKNWNQAIFDEMIGAFNLDPRGRVSRFSKGMQKQAVFALTMASKPDYLILDEPIDGLDPVVRRKVWSYIVNDVSEREMTVLVSSHNLREMEGICDSIGILARGKMILERDLDELKTDIHKVQVAYKDRNQSVYDGVNILHKESRGAVDLLIIKDKKELVIEKLKAGNPLIFDILPLTLEEIFIYELGGESNEIQSIIL